MSHNLRAALIAILFGGFLAVVLLVPAVALSYRRRGSAGPAWILGWFALAVHGMTLWTYTLLPVPRDDDFSCKPASLDPLRSVTQLRADPPRSLAELTRDPLVLQVVLNVALFVPLGFLLRAMFRRGVVIAALLGFATSLAIELTQYTGVWGFFRCAYRFFDVEDLISNTTGAVVGSLLAVLVAGRQQRSSSPSVPRPVTVWRRGTGMVCDLLAVVVPVALVQAAWRVAEHVLRDHDYTTLPENVAQHVAMAVVAAGHLAWIMVTGSTLGESTVMLRGVPDRHGVAATRVLRYVAGIGGFVLSLWFLPERFGFLALFLVAAHAVSVVPSRAHRGLGGWIAGSELVDVRSLRSPATSGSGR